MALSFSDRFTTTVASGYTSGGVTLILTSVSGLGISGACTFWLIVQAEGANTEEVFKVTNVSSTTLTVVGAQANTSASNHGAGAVVLASIMTKDAFTQYAADIVASVPSGAMVLLEQHTASSSASLDFTTCITSAYDDYEFRFTGIIPQTNTQPLVIQFSSDGGLNYIAGSDYAWQGNGSIAAGSGTAGNNSDSSMQLSFNIGTTANYSANGIFRLCDPLSAARFTMYQGYGGGFDTSNNAISQRIYNGFYKQTTAINAFRIKFASGQIVSGVCRAYGIAK